MMRFLRHSYTAIILGFLYLPIFILIVFSFNASKSRAVWEGFTLRWYEELIESEAILDALSYTLSVAVISSLAATVIGTLAAYAIYREMRPFERKISMNLTYVPLLNPDIVILTVLPKLRQFDRNLYDAALDLGASPAYAFRRIVLPEILPGILTGALFAFTLSVDDFVISFFTTGSGINNLSILIYSMARRGIHPTINALSTLLFLTVLGLLIAVNLRSEKTTGEEK